MEPDIVEIYVNKETKEILHFVPATGTLDNGEELPENAVFIKQINLDAIGDSIPIMICPHTDECAPKYGSCNHHGEHEYKDGCDEACRDHPFVGGCHLAEFTPVDDVGDEEEIS